MLYCIGVVHICHVSYFREFHWITCCRNFIRLLSLFTLVLHHLRTESCYGKCSLKLQAPPNLWQRTFWPGSRIKTKKIENLLQQLIAKKHANQFIYHLFNTVSSVFNNLLQSPLKDIARGTQNFLGGSRPIPAAIWPSNSRENHEKFGRPCSRGWITPKSLMDSGPGSLKASLPCWWTPECGPESTVGHYWAMWGRRVLLEGPRCTLEVLSGPWQQFTFQNVLNVPLAVQFHSWGLENKERPSSGCDGRPNHNRGWILTSTHSPAFHGCIPTPNTVILMVDALFNVKFLLVREHQIGQHTVLHEVQKV